MNYRLFYILIVLLVATSAFSQSQVLIDSLEQKLDNAEGNERAQILMELAHLYQSVSLEKSLEYDLENAALQEELGSIKNLSGTLNNIGVSYYLLGDYGKSLDYFEQSLKLREQLDDTVNIVKTLNNLGVIAQTAGDFRKALEYLNRSLIFKLDLNDTLSIAKTLNNIGVIYKDVNEFDDAERFLNQALNYYLALHDSSGIAAAYNNLGQVYEARGIHDSALTYYQKSLKIKRKLKDERGIGNTLNNIGKIYLQRGFFMDAESFFMEAVEIRRETGDIFGLASTLNNLGNLYYQQNKFEQSETYFMQSNQVAIREVLLGIQQRNYAGLAKLYEKMGNISRAFANFKSYAAIRDSVFNEDLNEQIADLKVQYQTEKRKRELELLRQENVIQELKISNSQKERVQFVAGFITLFFASLLVFLYLQYRNNKRLNQQLQQYNQELEARVKERTRELEEVNVAKDRFFSIIAHDLKSPFNGLLGFSKLLLEDFETLSNLEKKDFVVLIENSASGIYELLENLLDWAFSQTGRLQLFPQVIDPEPLIREVVQTNIPQQQNKRISSEIKINTNKKAFADVDTVKTILRNLYSNAIKFTPKGGAIEVLVEDYKHENGEDQFMIAVKDNGVGIRKEDIDSLFNLDKKHRSKGTEKETGTGLGLILCKDFVEKNGGQLLVDSRVGIGTVISFTLPVAD